MLGARVWRANWRYENRCGGNAHFLKKAEIERALRVFHRRDVGRYGEQPLSRGCGGSETSGEAVADWLHANSPGKEG